ncbi:MAG: hypothetical protein A3J07_04970 [Candidatus Doudnabacteria bacterium RIFCSPLOWO2_02_FULL_49_13]|uniref:Pilus assembly protein PilO n=1 Tax=Candidatus Doudnabacteria bacterium RIFCSPHIGHO2_12_FULL_48_16 TaxID=1817838 RepID=A0A1F5PKT5_9BACT|nr:MAG: hypothetical protein A3B77_04610 [Candidatus Doudnabacteria bacterium RIFCSPHIGHO2_02_FULL_49_24]OGE88170.1 MAG: hypothetical protein A2760_02260 [Candidatus Doudnabacteria bacterium RIFCSPHIGHO2_01_FULL_50_67]OGE90479.1 MAG: hypothetical protein A3E29_05040 [Candidatus Doudnabacteria bacterium RIFCSPHIGHO2_12_FULL_48_16]OGE96541.1 MAG: hypothetical protein A2990_03485 [Candidatus Doudnabacteria bacterium RIFCSPLOWO2_01_FULL_49_40]OGF02715.1 MAG: hypothetical protein A3J07_04970 [Candid
MTNSSFQSKIVLGLIVILGCFGVAYFYTTPQWTKYSQAKDNLVRKQAEGAQLTQALNAMQVFVGQYETRQTDLAKVNLALPSKNSDLPNLLASLSSLAQASGIVLSNFTILDGNTNDKPAPVHSIQTSRITFSASGSFESFKDFMMRLETDLRLIDADHVTIKADSAEIQYVINLRTYYQK